MREVGKNEGLRIWFEATDGDPCLSNEHKEFQVRRIAGGTYHFQSLTTNLNSCVCLNEDGLDIHPLHFLKNLRARLIKHPIVLFPSLPLTSLERTREILKVGAASNDSSQIGIMRDGSLAIHIRERRELAGSGPVRKWSVPFPLYPLSGCNLQREEVTWDYARSMLSWHFRLLIVGLPSFQR